LSGEDARAGATSGRRGSAYAGFDAKSVNMR